MEITKRMFYWMSVIGAFVIGLGVQGIIYLLKGCS